MINPILSSSRGEDTRSFTEVVSDVVNKIIEIAKTIFYVLAAPFIYAYEWVASLFESEETESLEDSSLLGKTLQPPPLRRISSGDIDLSHCNFDSILTLNKEGYTHIVAELKLAQEQREIWGDSAEDYLPDINSSDPKEREDAEKRQEINDRMAKKGLDLLIARPSTWALVYSLALDEEVFPLLQAFLKQKVQRENFLNGAVVTQRELSLLKIGYLFTRLTIAGHGLRAKCMKKMEIEGKEEKVFAFPGLNQGMTEGLPKDSEERIKFIEYICRDVRKKKPELHDRLHYNSQIVQEGVIRNNWRPFLGLVFDVSDLYTNLLEKNELENSTTDSLTDNRFTPLKDDQRSDSSISSSFLDLTNNENADKKKSLFKRASHKFDKRMNDVSNFFGNLIKTKSFKKEDQTETDP